MKKIFFMAVIFSQFVAVSSEEFQVDNIKIKCDCDKKNNGWKIEKIDKNWAQKSGRLPSALDAEQSTKFSNRNETKRVVMMDEKAPST